VEITLNGYHTLILAALVMLVGHWLVFRVRFLSAFNIPEPVAGGLLAAAIVYGLNVALGLKFRFSTELQTTFMLMFFSSIGLSADFTRLKEGGKPLVLLLVIVSCFIVVQNLIGVGLAAALGLQRAGVQVRIYEQAPALGEVGAGLSISPNGALGLKSLGVFDEFRDVAFAADEQCVRHFQTGHRTATVERGDLTATVSATGTIKPVVQVEVGSQVSGTVDRLHADYNSRVRDGEVLCALEPSAFRARLAQAEAAVARAEV